MVVEFASATKPVLACVGIGALEIAVIKPALSTLITGTVVPLPYELGINPVMSARAAELIDLLGSVIVPRSVGLESVGLEFSTSEP